MPDLADASVLVLEPMLATGGSLSWAVTARPKSSGATNVTALCVVTAPEGVSLVCTRIIPTYRVVAAASLDRGAQRPLLHRARPRATWETGSSELSDGDWKGRNPDPAILKGATPRNLRRAIPPKNATELGRRAWRWRSVRSGVRSRDDGGGPARPAVSARDRRGGRPHLALVVRRPRDRT